MCDIIWLSCQAAAVGREEEGKRINIGVIYYML
jgi:hypothetical protein